MSCTLHVLEIIEIVVVHNYRQLHVNNYAMPTDMSAFYGPGVMSINLSFWAPDLKFEKVIDCQETYGKPW